MLLLANVVIAIAYGAITVAIVAPVARAGLLRTSTLAVATSMIFFSGAVGHALHAVMTLLRDCARLPGRSPSGSCTPRSAPPRHSSSPTTTACASSMTIAVAVVLVACRAMRDGR
jgi:hypothetical protein